jgi:hypothetical protein
VQQLFHTGNAAEIIVMICDYVILAEKAVQFDRVESFGARIGRHAMDDEVDITFKLFDLRIVPVLAAVFDSQWMKMKDVEKDLLVSRGRPSDWASL